MIEPEAVPALQPATRRVAQTQVSPAVLRLCRPRVLKRAEGIAVSHNFIAQVWRDHDLQPQRLGTFKLSSDPEFETKVADVVGLYLDPPVGAVVLSIDEKTPVQALDRTQPVLPIDFAKTEKRTHDYVRHGTTNLFAALDTATGEVLGECYPRRRTEEFLKFMDTVVKRYPDREIHVGPRQSVDPLRG